MKPSLSTLRSWLPRRAPDAHKGDFGHVLVVAGSRGMAGAAALAARAALRSGCGLVTLATPEGIEGASGTPEALSAGLPETAAGTLRAEAVGRLQALHRSRSFTALALGPGLSTHPETARAVVGLLGSLAIPAVVDADALNVLAAQPSSAVATLLDRRGASCVLTPHPGELARLLAEPAAEVIQNRAAAALKLCGRLGAVCVLKGRGTLVTDGKRTYVNGTGNSGLAKGGTGDALTGVVAGLWAQRLRADSHDDGFEAAVLGAWLHGAAADHAAREKTQYSLLASDVIEALPAVFRKLA